MAGVGASFRFAATIFSVFLILRLGLSPLELVLLGTVLEVSYFLFEVPTGVVADTVSRKLSVVVGLVGTGVGFLLLGPHDVLDGGGLAGRSGGLRDLHVGSRCRVAWL